MTRYRSLTRALAVAAALLVVLGAIWGERAAFELTGWCWADVVDGDSLDCGGARVRLHGVSAPERFTPDGIAATSALVEIIDGGMVFCVPTGARTWGRDVAVCWREGRDLGAMLVALGVARNCAGYGGTYEDTPEGRRLDLPAYCLED